MADLLDAFFTQLKQIIVIVIVNDIAEHCGLCSCCSVARACWKKKSSLDLLIKEYYSGSR